MTGTPTKEADDAAIQGFFTFPRRKDWATRLTYFMKDSLDLVEDLKLDWSYVTCCSWVCDAIEQMTGHNPYEAFAGRYDTPLGAAKAIRASGFNTLDELVAYRYKEVPIGLAQWGDLVLVKTLDTFQAEEPDAGLVMPHGLALAEPPFFWCVTEEGLGRGDLYVQGVRAFAVGRPV